MRGPVRFFRSQIVTFEGGHADRVGTYRAHRIGQIRDVHIYRFISEVSGHRCGSLILLSPTLMQLNPHFIRTKSIPSRRHY